MGTETIEPTDLRITQVILHIRESVTEDKLIKLSKYKKKILKLPEVYGNYRSRQIDDEKMLKRPSVSLSLKPSVQSIKKVILCLVISHECSNLCLA